MEFGCGTGCMVTLPLVLEAFDVVGIDLDQRSIDYGRAVMTSYGADASRIRATDIAEVEGDFDVIIASEVLEHIESGDLGPTLEFEFVLTFVLADASW